MRKSDIETPALVLDLDAFSRNIALMNSRLADSPTKVRPHVKSHKTPQIALRQIEAGAIGVTCAKLGEAIAMVEGGVKDVLIANEIVGQAKCRKAAELAKRCNLIVACESELNVKELSDAAQAVGSTIGAIVEVEIGQHRCGVRSIEDAVTVAHAISKAPGLVFRGVMGYEGHCVFIQKLRTRRTHAKKALAKLVAAADAIRASGLAVEIVSSGGTGTFDITGHYPGITDIQAGSYILMDATYAMMEGIDFEHALTLLSTVVSHPEPDLLIMDYGLKSVTKEFGLPGPAPTVKRNGQPNPYGVEGFEVMGLSEEHAKLKPINPSRVLAIGDKVEIIPTHCCTTMNTYDALYVVQGEEVVDVWKITARGKSV